MTEEEAREKWCPFARFAAHQDASGANRWLNFAEEVVPNPKEARCIASDCMAWRWDVEHFRLSTGETIKPNEPYPATDCGERLSDKSGHCALAGKD